MVNANANATATNKKLSEIIKMIKRGELILQPDFQRKLVWNNKHKESFIDTILKGYPFPEVYFADGEIDLESGTSTTLVVDGQQRLMTISQYIDGDQSFVFTDIPAFSELTDDQKTNFYDYKIIVRDLGRLSIDQIKAIFKRINSIQYALEAIEIDNALYDGEFITVAKEISDNILFKKFSLLSESELSRMGDWEYILLIMSTFEVGGYFSSRREIEPTIILYNEDYYNKEHIKSLTSKVFKYIDDLNLPSDSLWFKKTSFFTLVVELMKLFNSSTMRIEKLGDKIKEFEDLVVRNKNEEPSKNQFALFYQYLFQGTTSRKGRVLRGEIFEHYLKT